jgi:predicted nuclease of predicted toxin-antitoxin system
MRLLANENVPLQAVEALRAAGHEVHWIAESGPSTEDSSVLALASQRGLTLLTMDKDFGELAVQRGLPAPCGIVLVRVAPEPSLVARVCVAALAAPANFARSRKIESDHWSRRRSLEWIRPKA